MSHKNSRERRLQKEFRSIEEESRLAGDDVDVTARLIDNDLHHWLGRIKGPVGTCYEGGIFYLEIIIPEDYPYGPPKIKFETKVWHPNISSVTGAICLDILKSEWSPALTLRTALLSIEALLSQPYPDDPQDAEVAAQYKNNFAEYERKAKDWVKCYARNTEWPQESKLRQLLDLGISAERASEALRKHNGDVNAAANECLGM